MIVCVDTPVWSLSLRRAATRLSGEEKTLQDELAALIREGRVCLLGPVRQEILSGTREETQFERLRERLRAFPDEPLTAEDYEEAARAHNRCRRAGISGSAVDFLICAAALRRQAAIFTTDADFRHYARHLPLQLHTPRPGPT